MLRKIRIITASIFVTLLTLFFLDFTGTIATYFNVLAQIQFIPALVGFNIGIVIVLIALTLLLGRVYCSVICPLGVSQDGINRISKKFNKKKRFSFSKAITWLRWSVVVLVVVSFFASFVAKINTNAVVSIFDPYGIFGRIVHNILQPLYKMANNGLAYIAERIDSYAFYQVDVIIHGGVTLLIAILSLIIVGVMSWRSGRSYCNSVCPVGTVLGFAAQYSLFKPRFNVSECNSCGLCERGCKSSCIDSKAKTIDYSRCVTCMNCINTCKSKSMTYSMPQKTAVEVVEEPVIESAEPKKSTSRREFLSIAGLFTFTSLAKADRRRQYSYIDGGLAYIMERQLPNRETPILPAGARNARQFARRCTACQLCVSVCPNRVLRPSNNFATLMQPHLSFERGYCRPECVKCSEVCPSQAIETITREERTAIKIGNAIWIKDNCLVYSEGVRCDNCSRHCPAGAIQMVPTMENPARSLPSINNERCIGCGACEFVCPSRPFSAIFVNGIDVHREI